MEKQKVLILSEEKIIRRKIRTTNTFGHNIDSTEEFKIKKTEKGIIFGVHKFIGDRMDSWATHRRFIAVKDNVIIDEFEREDGWNSPYAQTKYSDWKKEILNKFNESKD